jgi:hypothetical protein
MTVAPVVDIPDEASKNASAHVGKESDRRKGIEAKREIVSHERDTSRKPSLMSGFFVDILRVKKITGIDINAITVIVLIKEKNAVNSLYQRAVNAQGIINIHTINDNRAIILMISLICIIMPVNVQVQGYCGVLQKR